MVFVSYGVPVKNYVQFSVSVLRFQIDSNEFSKDKSFEHQSHRFVVFESFYLKLNNLIVLRYYRMTVVSAFFLFDGTLGGNSI